MARYVKTQWNTTTVYNPTNMNHIEQGIYDADLREGGTITGNLTVDSNNSTSTTTDARFLLGNNIPNGTTGSTRGVLSIYDKNQFRASIIAGNGGLTTDRLLTIPDKTGTIALTRDVSDFTGLGDCGIGESIDITNKNYNNYMVTVVITSMSPNLYFPFVIERGNLGNSAVKFLQGSWVTGSYGQSIELLASNTSIKLNSVYVNGSQLTGNARMYVSGRYPI